MPRTMNSLFLRCRIGLVVVEGELGSVNATSSSSTLYLAGVTTGVTLTLGGISSVYVAPATDAVAISGTATGYAALLLSLNFGAYVSIDRALKYFGRFGQG